MYYLLIKFDNAVLYRYSILGMLMARLSIEIVWLPINRFLTDEIKYVALLIHFARIASWIIIGEHIIIRYAFPIVPSYCSSNIRCLMAKDRAMFLFFVFSSGRIIFTWLNSRKFIGRKSSLADARTGKIAIHFRKFVLIPICSDMSLSVLS